MPAKPERSTCAYCEVPIRKGTMEWEHFPIPKECGGDQVMPVCSPCHDAVDRFEILEVAGQVAQGFSEMTREQRWLVARLVKCLYRIQDKVIRAGVDRP